MAGGEPRLGTTATYMRHNDHGGTCQSTGIDRLHDLRYNEYQVFSAASVRKWSKFGLACTSHKFEGRRAEKRSAFRRFTFSQPPEGANTNDVDYASRRWRN